MDPWPAKHGIGRYVRSWEDSGLLVLWPSLSAHDLGCVKTCASRECAELFTPLSALDRDCQCCCFPIQRNRDKISSCKFDIGVFTQPGRPTTDSGRLPEHALARIAKGDGLFLESFTEQAYRRSHALLSTARLSLSIADF